MELDWTIILAVLAIIIGIYYYLSSKDSNVFQQHGIPHHKPVSILTQLIYLFVFPKSYVEYVQMTYNIHTDAKYVGIFDFNKPLVTIRDLELLKSITIKNFNSFEDHYDHFSTADRDPLFQNNLIALRGDKWRNIRALLSPAFTSSKMKMMFQLMTDCAVNFTEHLKNVPPEKRVMEMKDIFTKYATDTIATCAFGISVDSMKNPDNEFYLHSKKAANFMNMITIMKMILSRYLPTIARLLRLQIINDRTNEFFMKLVADTIKTRDEKNISRPDMLQLMMDSRGKRESGKELTIQEMTSQAFIFLLGGFDTTSTAMSYAAYEIAVNPHVQAKLHDEIDMVLKEHTNGQPSYEAINGMTYLNAVINETLRMYPPAPLLDRMCVKDFMLPAALPDAKPYLVKKGATVWLPYYSFQHDAKYFPEPDKFKPERFIESNGDQCNLDAYHPFGLGPRMCIGNRFALLEMKVLLFHLLARCELKTCEKTPIPLKFKNDFTLLIEGGFWLNITPRQTTH